MSLSTMPFERRLKRIMRNHRRMSHGVTHKVTSSGLIIARPRGYVPRFPIRGLFIAVVAVFVFKGFVYVNLGAQSYELRVAELTEGTAVEKIGAWVMQVDPATTMIAAAWRAMGV